MRKVLATGIAFASVLIASPAQAETTVVYLCKKYSITDGDKKLTAKVTTQVIHSDNYDKYNITRVKYSANFKSEKFVVQTAEYNSDGELMAFVTAISEGGTTKDKKKVPKKFNKAYDNANTTNVGPYYKLVSYTGSTGKHSTTSYGAC